MLPSANRPSVPKFLTMEGLAENAWNKNSQVRQVLVKTEQTNDSLHDIPLKSQVAARLCIDRNSVFTIFFNVLTATFDRHVVDQY